jgi:hypothetical protein
VRLDQLNDALAISPPPSHAGSPYETITSKETLKRMTTSIFRHHDNRDETAKFVKP